MLAVDLQEKSLCAWTYRNGDNPYHEIYFLGSNFYGNEQTVVLPESCIISRFLVFARMQALLVSESLCFWNPTRRIYSYSSGPKYPTSLNRRLSGFIRTSLKSLHVSPLSRAHCGRLQSFFGRLARISKTASKAALAFPSCAEYHSSMRSLPLALRKHLNVQVCTIHYIILDITSRIDLTCYINIDIVGTWMKKT